MSIQLRGSHLCNVGSELLSLNTHLRRLFASFARCHLLPAESRPLSFQRIAVLLRLLVRLVLEAQKLRLLLWCERKLRRCISPNQELPNKNTHTSTCPISQWSRYRTAID
jgi:hypothetical protein